MASQINGVSIVCATVGLVADQRKQRSASLAFVHGIHRWPVNSPHKMPITRKMFPFDDVIMLAILLSHIINKIDIQTPGTWPIRIHAFVTEKTWAPAQFLLLELGQQWYWFLNVPTVPSHYLNQCWLIIRKVLRIHVRAVSQKMSKMSILDRKLKFGNDQSQKFRVRVRNFIRQHQSSSYTQKSISFTVKYLYSIQYTWLSTEQFIIMPYSSNSNCDVVRGPH